MLAIGMEAALIKPDDWHRLLAGDTPWMFLVEIALRSAVVYLTLIVAVRLLGRRIASGMTLLELSIVFTLAAAGGAVLESPTHGLLPTIVVIFVTAALHRAIAHWGVRRRKVEHVVTGDSIVVLVDGRLLMDKLHTESLTQARLFGMLRGNGVQHLGELSRVFCEASGAVSYMRALQPRLGLSVLPDVDEELHREVAVQNLEACCRCGFTAQRTAAYATCRYCGNDRWSHAVHTLEH